MPKFGKDSLRQRATLHPKLQRVLDEGIKYVDFAIVEGHRGEAAQNAAVAKGASKVKWPNSRHNTKPSRAVDVAPWPIDWSDEAKALERFTLLAGFLMGIAAMLGIKVRWGGDWNHNFDTRDENFRDRPHLELDEEEE